MAFKRATKQQARLRMAITGPAGSGKTLTALLVARELAGPTGKVAVLDTEHGSASKYADRVEFDADDGFAPPWHPNKFVEGIAAAEKAGYEVLVIDSLSHAWAGQGGLLEEVDHIAARSKTGNSFAAWKDATPIQHKMIEAILGSKLHVIVTMRSKTEWVLDAVNRNGKTVQVPRRVGMAPVQRDGVDYEFDVVLDMDHDHRGVVSKSRCSELADAVIDRPGANVADALRAWLAGAPAPARAAEPPQNPAPTARQPTIEPANAPAEEGAAMMATQDQVKRIGELALNASLPDAWRSRLTAKLAGPLTAADATSIIGTVETELAKRAKPADAGVSTHAASLLADLLPFGVTAEACERICHKPRAEWDGGCEVTLCDVLSDLRKLQPSDRKAYLERLVD